MSSPPTTHEPPSGRDVQAPATSNEHALREAFDAATPLTVGVEEEAMLLDPRSLDLLPRAADALAGLAGDPRFTLELPAAQLEIVLPPARTVAEIAVALATARRDLAAAVADTGIVAAAGAHPFSAAEGPLNAGGRYEQIVGEYSWVARRMLVGALQVHVAVGGHERTLAVHDALRSHLPEIAALAANAPFYEGRDTGLASIRAKLCDLLPRQGVPPALGSWAAHAEALRWGAAAGRLRGDESWWWELRPRAVHGTLEVRVPDAQATVADAAAVTAFVHALVAWLAARYDAGDLPAPDPTWRIEENRWAACRHGLDARFADLATGATTPVRDLLAERVRTLSATARALGCAAELALVEDLLEAGGGAGRQRAAGDARAAAAWLAEVYVPA